jgi:hypothetical protein
MNQRVLVTVEGGMTRVGASGDVEVLTIDYDIEGVDEAQLAVDARGEQCIVRRQVITNPGLVSRTFGHFDPT